MKEGHFTTERSPLKPAAHLVAVGIRILLIYECLRKRLHLNSKCVRCSMHIFSHCFLMKSSYLNASDFASQFLDFKNFAVRLHTAIRNSFICHKLFIILLTFKIVQLYLLIFIHYKKKRLKLVIVLRFIRWNVYILLSFKESHHSSQTMSIS